MEAKYLEGTDIADIRIAARAIRPMLSCTQCEHGKPLSSANACELCGRKLDPENPAQGAESKKKKRKCRTGKPAAEGKRPTKQRKGDMPPYGSVGEQWASEKEPSMGNVDGKVYENKSGYDGTIRHTAADVQPTACRSGQPELTTDKPESTETIKQFAEIILTSKRESDKQETGTVKPERGETIEHIVEAVILANSGTAESKLPAVEPGGNKAIEHAVQAAPMTRHEDTIDIESAPPEQNCASLERKSLPTEQGNIRVANAQIGQATNQANSGTCLRSKPVLISVLPSGVQHVQPLSSSLPQHVSSAKEASRGPVIQQTVLQTGRIVRINDTRRHVSALTTWQGAAPSGRQEQTGNGTSSLRIGRPPDVTFRPVYTSGRRDIGYQRNFQPSNQAQSKPYMTKGMTIRHPHGNARLGCDETEIQSRPTSSASSSSIQTAGQQDGAESFINISVSRDSGIEITVKPDHGRKQ